MAEKKDIGYIGYQEMIADITAALESFRQKAAENMEKEIKQALGDYAEQISVFLQQSIGEERLAIQKYMGDLSTQLDIVNDKFFASGVGGLTASIGLDAATNLAGWLFTITGSTAGLGLFGLGGAIEGYRAAGAKGAVTGLVSGGLASFAAMMALSSVGGVTLVTV